MNAIQRIEAYKFVLKQFEDGTNRYVFSCADLRRYASDKGWEDIKQWPEFKAQKPDILPSNCSSIWWDSKDIESRKTALRNSIDLAYYNLLVETVKTFGLPSLPIPMNDTAKVFHHMITCNGVTCKDTVKSGYRARIANIIHDHGMNGMIGKEVLYDTNEYGNGYYYKRHYVKPEHVGAAVECYLRINVTRAVKARKSKVLEAMGQESV